MNILKRIPVWAYVTIASIVMLVSVHAWMWGGQTLRMFFTSGRWPTLLIGVIAVSLTVIIAAWIYISDIGNKRVFPISLILASVAAIIWVSIATFTVNYSISKAYTDSINVEKDIDNSSVSFEERAPLEVAQNSATRTMQDTIGSPEAVKSVPDSGENGNWNSLIVRPGIGVGYEAIQTVDVPMFGSVTNKNVTFCEFSPEANLRLGGFLPQNNLRREVFSMLPLSVTLEPNDVYGYCDGDTPMVVMPLQQVKGVHNAHGVAYGVATYNGETGKVNIYTDVKDLEKIPGATYPNSIAENQRHAFTATGSFADHWFQRIGWVAADSSNSAEVKLMDEGNIKYVTSLNSNGSSSTVVGISVVDARFTGEELNPISVNLYKKSETRKAMSALAENVQTSYANLTDWATGLQVFEIIPGKDGSWVASLGKEQSVLYRAEISADETIVLRDAEGNIVKNNSRGEGSGAGENVTLELPSDIDLSSLSKDELKALIQEAVDELASR